MDIFYYLIVKMASRSQRTVSLTNMSYKTYNNIVSWRIKMNIDVDFYELPDGTEPVREFLNSLDIKMRAKMYREIDLLVINGPELREPHSKHLEDGIFELRAKQSNDISRVLYFFFIGKKAVLTNGFVKKTKKTPKKERELAKRYRRDYEMRHPDGR